MVCYNHDDCEVLYTTKECPICKQLDTLNNSITNLENIIFEMVND
jgi:hypothetical protein